MLSNLKKFYLLDAQQKHLFFEAYITLNFYRLAIVVRSFKSLVTECEQTETVTAENQLDEASYAMAGKIGEAISTAANHTPWQSACLVQVLTAQRMLRKREIAGRFHLGVTMNSVDDGPLAAHAWTMCGDEILTGKSGHESYTVISTFSWK